MGIVVVIDKTDWWECMIVIVPISMVVLWLKRRMKGGDGHHTGNLLSDGSGKGKFLVCLLATFL